MSAHDDARGPSVHGRRVADEQSRRLESVAKVAGLSLAGSFDVVESYSNDTWLFDHRRFGPSVLRVCYRGDPGRLLREAAVGRALPPSIGYPEVLDAGEALIDGQRLTWSLTRRLTGTTLLDAWPDLSASGRRDAARSFADALRALHTWRVPASLVASLSFPMSDTLHTSTDVIGASMHPLPVERVRMLLDALSRVEGVDSALVQAAARTIDRLRYLAPAVDDPAIGGLIHGDLQMSNIWWNDHGEAGLIDLEWVRFAPPWVDLARLRDNADADAIDGLDTHGELLEWMREDYPELFDVDRLDDRLRFLCLTFQVRQALIWPKPSSAEPIAADHPLRMLERLV